MRLAIVAAPPLVLVSAITAALALRPPVEPTTPPIPDVPPEASPAESSPPGGCHALAPPATCEAAHSLVVHGHVSGQPSHVRLAGPILYTDVTTNAGGYFDLTVPIDGDVCSVLREPANFSFTDGSMQVAYTIGFGR